MQRNFICEMTGERCQDTRCKKGVCFQMEDEHLRKMREGVSRRFDDLARLRLLASLEDDLVGLSNQQAHELAELRRRLGQPGKP